MEKNIVKLDKYRTNRLEWLTAILLIAAFAAFFIFSFASDKTIRSYEVQSEALSNDFSCRALALRNESIVYSDNSGYLILNVDDQKRVSTNGLVLETVAGISENIQNNNSLTSDLKNSNKSVKEIREKISDDLVGFTGDDVSQTVKAFDSIDGIRESIIVKSGNINYSFDGSNGIPAYSSSDGVISYVCFDTSGLDASSITSELFLSDDTPSASNRTGSRVERGSFLYRICNDENWTILAGVSESFYLSVIDRTSLSFTLENEIKCENVPCRLLRVDDNYFIELDMHEYMSKFINKKYLNITFKNESASGYKIPISAICEKEFYMIPNDLVIITQGQTTCGLNVVTADSKGNEKTVRINAERYYSDNEYTYISGSDIESGSKLVNDKTGEIYNVSLKKNLEGVYCINKGYTIFRRIERINSTKDYCIIRKDTSYGLSLYDHIVLDASNVDGSMII